MMILCVDTSNKVLDFTLAQETSNGIEKIGFLSNDVFGRMNESFFLSFENFLSKYKVNPQDIGRWVVITGPGSFTGIRIGISILSGLCTGYKKELHGISALDAKAVLSGKQHVGIGAKLKPDEYVCRDYNFETGVHSGLYITNSPVGLILVNSGNISSPSLTDAVVYPQSWQFVKKAEPEYVRKSEAELNFDKKSEGK